MGAGRGVTSSYGRGICQSTKTGSGADGANSRHGRVIVATATGRLRWELRHYLREIAIAHV